jgi:hypothetical protein
MTAGFPNAKETAGLAPWFPWPLSRWGWLTRPVPAERLAALRIGLAAVLLLDVLTTRLPGRADFYGPDGVGSPWRRAMTLPAPAGWSVVDDESPGLVLALVGWSAAALGLLVGFYSRLCALAAWALSVSFSSLDPWVENAGDTVRGLCLLYLALSPCGAAWSLDARRRPTPRPALVHPWPLRLLFLQMALIYFCNGLHKVAGADWPMGRSVYLVMGDLTLTRWSAAQFRLPWLLTRVLTWVVLAWELLFPLLVLWKPTRKGALWLGVAFHLGTLAALEIGFFPLYMLCLYLPLVPWELSAPSCQLSARQQTLPPASGWERTAES